MKIGQVIILDQDVEFTSIGGATIKASRGDQGFIKEDGSVQLINGNAKNRIFTTKIKPDGVDHRSIAELIFKKLNTELDLGMMLQESDLEDEHCIEAVESILEDIF